MKPYTPGSMEILTVPLTLLQVITSEHYCICLNKAQYLPALPQAWPCSWDVEFKLAAPRNTVVSGKMEGGVLVDFDVSPGERRSSVRVLPCQNVTLLPTW